jgi:uncharacterized protein
MILDGEYVFQGPRERVWELLLDPEVMAKAMPGAKRLVRVDEGRYEGVIRIGIGPVTAAEWRLMVTISDTVPPERYLMGVDSQGPVGFTRGTATVNLHDEAGTTRMAYRAELQIGGRVASVGQRLLDQVAKLLTRQGLEALSRELEARLAESEGSSHSDASGTADTEAAP